MRIKATLKPLFFIHIFSMVFVFSAVIPAGAAMRGGSRDAFSESLSDPAPDGRMDSDDASELADAVPAEAAFLEIGQQIDRLESRVHRRQDTSEEAKSDVEQLRKKRSEAIHLKNRLDEPGGEESTDIETQYVSSLADLKDSLKTARSAILPKEEAYHWDAKLRLDEMKDKIDHLKRSAPAAGEPDDFKKNVGWLEAKRSYARQKLVRMNSVKGQDWQEMRSDLEEMFNDLTFSYNDLKSQAGIWASSEDDSEPADLDNY